MNSSSALQYRLSGELGRGAVFLPLITSALGVSAGYAFGYFNYGLGQVSIRFSCAVSIVFAMLFGWSCVACAKRVHCRNPRWFYGSLIIASLISLHAFAVGLINCALMGQNALSYGNSLWLHPIGAQEMVYRFGILFVIHELFLASSVYFAWRLFHKDVYCEDCLMWLPVKKLFICLPVPNSPEGRTALRTGNLEFAAAQAQEPAIARVRKEFVRLDYVLCRCCGNFGAYQLIAVKDVERSWSAIKRNESALSPVMTLDPLSTGHLALLLHRPAPKIQIARPALRKPVVRKPIVRTPLNRK